MSANENSFITGNTYRGINGGLRVEILARGTRGGVSTATIRYSCGKETVVAVRRDWHGVEVMRPLGNYDGCPIVRAAR